VFIVGAGASCELNFPYGAELLKRIGSALDIRFDRGYRQLTGDSRIYEAFRDLAHNDPAYPDDANLFFQAA
jgi:hypothetical protein